MNSPLVENAESEYGWRQWSGWFLGPGWLLMVVFMAPPAGLSQAGWLTVGAAGLMAIWWITETIPIAATAMLPLALFPALGLGSIKEAATPYSNPLVFLFLGGFIIALAMQRWGLHRRVAITLIGACGTRPTMIIAGFLISGALISMWVSNTATALMMLPIATSVAALAPNSANDRTGFSPALLLAVAYGSTTGGMATLIGTPPNALLAGHLSDIYGFEIGFGQWMLIGLPVTLIALPLVFLVLTRVAFRISNQELPGMKQLIADEKTKIGSLTYAEGAVGVVFLLTAGCWIFRPLISQAILAIDGILPVSMAPGLVGQAAEYLNDTSIAIAGALLLFLIPVDRKRGEFVMNWETTRKLPWGVLLLFGGGLSLANMIEQHGLAEYIGSLFSGLDGWPIVIVMSMICFGILMLTELTSNTATAATFLPIVGAIAIQMGESPLLLLVPTALAANCSYMMPVGTPPNAIVFGSGMIKLPQMARAGLLLNIILVPVVVIVVLLLGRFVFDYSAVSG